MLEDVNIMILSELSASDTLESWDSDRRQYAFDLVKKEADYEAAWNLVSGDFYSYTQREWFASALSALLVLEKPDDVIEIIDRLNSGEILDNNAQKVAWSVKYGTTDLVKKAYVAKKSFKDTLSQKEQSALLVVLSSIHSADDFKDAVVVSNKQMSDPQIAKQLEMLLKLRPNLTR